MILRRSSTLSRPLLLRPAYPARVCYYHPPEVHSNKGEEFFITASFPDDFEAPSLVKKRDEQGQSLGHWDEFHATSSEVSVKADRGDINIHQQQQQQRMSRDLDRNLQEAEEPRIDEM
ncbi:hypothetical protein BO78DRAFT_319738 [Aspergillus sclerotiicarbonarius CBS 121057]|uniref:Uncharacterized protein n=1 Tax=Aspergillus sclerotiicarbonarius (strain CBS 121057 / IBT 28362) TaxID=1448318 RepID=A0A319E473_ASPSB|nr:hypothetical protein BO78DRAFT_319738 [Aspergillus sclerotiicarbonarius CBS 121057]